MQPHKIVSRDEWLQARKEHLNSEKELSRMRDRLAADPVHQGKGYGSALLAHALQRCDRDGLPTYFESSNAANIPLYERHGFKLVGEIQSGSSPKLYPMLREPR